MFSSEVSLTKIVSLGRFQGNGNRHFMTSVWDFECAEPRFLDFERGYPLELIFSPKKVVKTDRSSPQGKVARLVLLRVHVEAALAKVIFDMIFLHWRPSCGV